MDAESGRMPCLSLITWKSSEEFLASFRKKRIANGQSKKWEGSLHTEEFLKGIHQNKIKCPAASAITHDNKCRITRVFCSLLFLQLVHFFSCREAAWKILLFVAVAKYAGSACLKKQKPWQECWLPWQSKQSRALGCCGFYHKDKKNMSWMVG